MEDGLDTPIDLGFVNYKKHPSDTRYMVFRFKNHDMAAFFKDEMTNQKIWFEEGEEVLKSEKKVILFGVHNTDYKKAQKINYLASAKYRSPFIENKPLRILLLSFFFILVAFAIFGIIKVNYYN